MVQGYCVKCKAKREIQNKKATKMKNGMWAWKGTCPKCRSGMYRIHGKTKPN